MIFELRRKYLEFFEQKNHLIYPSASLRSEDPTLFFNSAGMVQFKPYFLGATPKFAGVEGIWHRVTTAQKCLRINDIENVGRTLRHHSFFEMMGNFSFGDYFKKEAAQWAWEFLTSKEWLGLDPDRLFVTVYLDDDEAFEVWTKHVGVPAERVSRWGEDENFWPANAVSEGPNGPCGPCSEIFFDRGPQYGSADETGPNTGSGDRYIEIWNLVFTQFDRQEGGRLEPLPQKNIDTGMGFERVAAVMTDSEDAYATALFQPTIRRVAELSGKPYGGAGSLSHRVVADHLRAVTFCIADGIMPANDGAGYVVKMLLRRASRHAWLLGLREPVLWELVEQVVEAMGEAYPEIKGGQERIQGIVKAEEEQFLRTLESGIQRVGQILDQAGKGGELPGEVAFDLWQTYGFPLDLTRDLAAECGVAVDGVGFEAARERARKLSRGGRESQALFTAASDTLGGVAREHGETQFLGYEAYDANAQVLALIEGERLEQAAGEGVAVEIVLDRSPFYPEGGGQIGDAGKLEWPGGAALVTSTSRSSQGLLMHRAKIARGRIEVGQQVRAVVDPARQETQKHHTATHLLHAALRSVLGKHVAQAGSLVAPERLRFDFSHPQALTGGEVERIETLVNRWIQGDFAVDWRTVSIEEARECGAIMLFGEKYGSEVRMVTIGSEGASPSNDQGALVESAGEGSGGVDSTSVSVELCGGTHVRRTGQIGSFVVVSEEAVSAGVRRLEARVGMASLDYLHELRGTLTGLAAELGAAPADLSSRVGRLQVDLKSAQRESASLRDRLATAQAGGGSNQKQKVEEAGGFRYLSTSFDGLDSSSLRTAADNLLLQSGADLVVAGSEGLLVVKVSAEARARGAHAGNLVRELAKRAGGNGGGRPDMAQAGLKDSSRLPEALSALPEILATGVAG
ncbi:MAG: alanine--tRNA ligase [Trueperaceae bacterium]